jgi:uncharacterized membrane protein
MTAEGGRDGTPDFGDLIDELEALESEVDDADEREQVREAVEMAVAVQGTRNGVFGRVIHGFDRADAAEALLGAVIFGVPMFVEGGTQEVGAFLAAHPSFLVLTYAFAVGLVVGILYVADIQDVRIKDPLLGVVPRRLLGVVGISMATALLLMSAWGRVDWADPWLSFAQVTVAFVPMVIGASLGDILPGS